MIPRIKITLLAGGVGGSKLGLGFHLAGQSELTVIVNTGDDVIMHGLHVSPDPDILLYTLAGIVNPVHGWGIKDETFTVAKGLAQYGRETWFQLGDRDLATHIHRTAMLKEGASLSQAIDSIRRALGVSATVLPVTDGPLTTMIDSDEGALPLQDYLVRRRCEPVVRAISFRGADRATPAAGVIAAIADADLVVIAPSNPLISIGPILAVPGITEALRRRRDNVIAVTPLVSGKSLKGPTDKMMSELGYQVSPASIATMYSGFCGAMVIDQRDADQRHSVEASGMRVALLDTVMNTADDKRRLALDIIAAFGLAA